MNRLIELRGFCESISLIQFKQLSGCLLSSSEWENIEKTASTLKPFAVLTKLLQKEKFSLSDFFGQWAKIKMEVTKMKDDTLASNLLLQMQKREKDLFNNNVLNASVFLDPRYQQYMPVHNKENAIEFLKALHSKVNEIESENVNNEQQTDNDELNSFMNTMMYENEERIENNENVNETTLTVSQTLRNFIGIKEPLNTSVFDYWEKIKHLQPMLYKLASIVHAVPPTQTTVERSFSAMGLLLSPRRTRISDKNLENSLLVRLNRELFLQNTPQ